MDPSLFGVVHELAPVLAAFFFLSCPVGILWVVKHYRVKMKELEIEAASVRSDARLETLEKRVAGLESALGAPVPRTTLQERAELLQGPPDASRVR